MSGQLLVLGPRACLRVAPRGCSQRSCQSEASLDYNFWQNCSEFVSDFSMGFAELSPNSGLKILSGSSAVVTVVTLMIAMTSDCSDFNDCND